MKSEYENYLEERIKNAQSGTELNNLKQLLRLARMSRVSEELEEIVQKVGHPKVLAELKKKLDDRERT